MARHWSFDMTLSITDLGATLETLRTLIWQEINNIMVLSEYIGYDGPSEDVYYDLQIDFIIGIMKGSK